MPLPTVTLETIEKVRDRESQPEKILARIAQFKIEQPHLFSLINRNIANGSWSIDVAAGMGVMFDFLSEQLQAGEKHEAVSR